MDKNPTPTAPAIKPVVVILDREDEKKHSIRYKENVAPNQPAVLGLVYVPRTTLMQLGNPTRLAFALQPA